MCDAHVRAYYRLHYSQVGVMLRWCSYEQALIMYPITTKEFYEVH